MLNKLFAVFRTKTANNYLRDKQKLVLLDGDQPLLETLAAYSKYIEPLKNCETYFIQLADIASKGPKVLKYYPNINSILLSRFSPGKEIVDKYIFGYIQTAISKGYTDITIISSDYDFIDIFQMSNLLNDNRNIKFCLIIPRPIGKLKNLKSGENITIIKD